MRCDDRRLKSLLLDADEGAEYQEAARHIESCPQCRRTLDELSGADGLMAEACETLRVRGEATLDAPHNSPSVVIAVEPLMGEESPVDYESVSLSFLEPARHPEMLGRIGRYDVERLIGAGGMGVVLKGFDTELHRVVAIKVLLPHLADSGAARRRFAREAKAAAAVVHEHVIPIYNVETDGPLPYLVMQFVPGQSLQARVDEHGPLQIKEVLRIARQAAAGLAAAHAQGVVHRDVKPANILLEESVDRVLLSDFGLARTVDDATLTRTGVLAGTPHYMSPEQASGHAVDHLSDLFSLGSVLYFMCTGRPPYRAESPMAVLNRICHEPHRPVDEINADVPVELAELIDRLLAKSPANRFAGAQAVEARCAGLLSQLQQGLRLRSRSWLRRFRRNSPLLRRVTVGIIAAIVCMSLGALLPRLWTPVAAVKTASTVTERTAAPTARTSADTNGETPHDVAPKDEVPALLPDTFHQDALETKTRLTSLENRSAADPSRETKSDDGQFQSDLSRLRDALSQLEASWNVPQSNPASSGIRTPDP